MKYYCLFLVLFVTFRSADLKAQNPMALTDSLSHCTYYNWKIDSVSLQIDSFSYLAIINFNNCIDCVKYFPDEIKRHYPGANKGKLIYLFISESEYFSPAIDKKFLQNNNPDYKDLPVYFLSLYDSCFQDIPGETKNILTQKSPFLLLRTSTGWKVDNRFIYGKK